MKLTPLDIHHKEFHRAIRGYNEEEVDKFLDEVAEEFERVFKENIELKEQVEKAQQDLESYSGMEKTLHNTLLTAQKSAEEIVSHSNKEAELILRDAELKAKEVIQEAYDLKGKYESTLNHLKQAEEEFRGKFKSMLQSYMRIADSTAVLADIGSNIGRSESALPALERYMEIERPLEIDHAVEAERPVEAEKVIPRIGMARLEETGEVVLPATFDIDGITAEELLTDAFPAPSETQRSSLKEIKREDPDRSDNFDIDSLAF